MPEFFYGSETVSLRPDTDCGTVAKAVAAARRSRGSVVVSFRAEQRLPAKLVAAAVQALDGEDDALVYVLGDAANMVATDLNPFREVRHLSLNIWNLSTYAVLAEFTSLRTLIIQRAGPRPVVLDFLRGAPQLTRLAIPASVRHPDALASCSRLSFLHCSSSEAVLAAMADHPALRYLDINFGTNRDFRDLPSIPSLRGLALFQVRGLTGDDLAPISACRALHALSLGALRNVTHLAALRGEPRHTLEAILIENLPNLENLFDVAGCEALSQIGIYDCHPKDRSLRPLRPLKSLTHLVLGQKYPDSEIAELLSWYGGSLRYRDKIERGEFRPRWRTPIDRLG